MRQLTSVNRSGKAAVIPSSTLPVYPPICELQFTLGIPTIDQFDVYLVLADADGTKLLSYDEYFTRVGPPYCNVYALFCTNDDSNPSSCKVVHYVARIEGLSRSREIPEVGTLCTAYMWLLTQPGQAPEIEYVGESRLSNIKKPTSSATWATNMIFRPSYDRVYGAPDMPDSFAVKWTREESVIVYQGVSSGSTTPAYESQIYPAFQDINWVDATQTGILCDDSLHQGRLHVLMPGDELWMHSKLFSLVAATMGSDMTIDFCWACLQRRGDERILNGKLLLTKDPTHPKTKIEAGVEERVAGLSLVIAGLWHTMPTG